MLSQGSSAADLALQVRRNAEEQRECLKELLSWERDIKEKDKSHAKTSKKSASSISRSDAPPIRDSGSLTYAKEEKKKDAVAEKPLAKPKRISGYDFKAWDKFDADAAANDVDRPPESSSKIQLPKEIEKEDEAEEEERIEKSLIHKEKGNEYFKRGELKKALKHYSLSILFDHSQTAPLINRALVHLKMKNWRKAEEDCTSGLNLEPKNIKALWRRGVARSALGLLLDAEADLQKALTLEPSNQLIKEELSKVRDVLKNKPKSTTPELKAAKRPEKTSNVVSSDFKKPESSTQISETVAEVPAKIPPRRRTIEIREYGEYVETAIDVKSPQRGKLIESVEPKVHEKPKITEMTETDFPFGKKVAVSYPSEKARSIEILQNSKTGDVDKDIEKISPRISERNLVDTKPTVISPTTMFEFERVLKECKNDDDALCRLIKSLQPGAFKSLFKSSFESRHLQVFISVLDKRFVGIEPARSIFNILKGLSTIDRFDTIALFMSKKDKEAMRRVVESIKADLTTDETKSVCQQFRLAPK
ncbi:RNA polymerase II-associated protein 3 [Dinochytrium kinnereticum]|nr:RNA polymerase II-associated protein 3 [Dinochytrium kinnereticum]